MFHFVLKCIGVLIAAALVAALLAATTTINVFPLVGAACFFTFFMLISASTPAYSRPAVTCINDPYPRPSFPWFFTSTHRNVHYHGHHSPTRIVEPTFPGYNNVHGHAHSSTVIGHPTRGPVVSNPGSGNVHGHSHHGNGQGSSHGTHVHGRR